MAFNAEGGSFGPSRRTHEYRADPYSLGAIRESAFNMASRIFRSVETWIRSEPNSDPLPWADRGSDPALDGLLRAQASPFGIRSRSDDKVDQEEATSLGLANSRSQLKRPSPLQVEAGGLRMAGAPRGLPFRHPDTPCQSSLTARPVHHEITKGTLLGPLDEVLARYVQDRTGGSEGMHVFNFNAKERLDFEAKIGRDLARLAKSSRPGRSSVFDTVVSAPRPALDVWSAPPRGFCLGGAQVVAPPELPPAAKRRKVNASSLRRITAADESDDIVEVAESVPPSDDVEVVEAPKSDKKTIAVKSAPKRPKKASVEAEVVEVGEKEVKKVTTDEDFWRVQIEAIYRRRNPHRLAQVASLMEKHKGKELILYQQVCQRYDLNPKKFYADPKSWESEDKDVKDDDDAPEVSQSGVPSSKGLIDASAPPSSGKPVFGASGSAALFGKEASSGSSLLFDIPPAPTDPDKKINIFASGTQAEKRFATADSGSPFGSENSSSLFASSGASSGGLFSLAPAGEPSEEPKPAFPPTPLFGSSETTDVLSVPNLFGSDPGSKEVKSSTTPGSGFGGIFGGSAASTGASVFGSSSGSLFGGSSSSTSIFGSSKESSGANLFGSAEASSGSPKEASSDSAGGIFTFGLSKESKEPEKQSAANIFGSSSGSSVGNLFGSGSGAPATSLFSASSSASSGASLFGSASASSSSKGFGESSKESSGGSIFASGSLSFGTSSSSSAVGLFGTGAVGNEPPKAKQSTGSIFLSPTTDGNLFGTSNSSASAGSLFGGSSSSTSIFGSSKESSGANLFGSAKASSGSAKEASSDSAGGIFTFGFSKESKEPEKQSAANIFGSSSGSSVGNLFGNKVEDQSKGPGQFGADATFGRQISALSDPFGLNAEEPTNKRRASLESEETGNEPRRKADPEVLAKRKIVRGRRSVVSSVKREEAPIAEFPPQPPPGGLFQTDISGGFPPQPPAELLAVSTPLETSKAPEPQKAEKEETKEGPTPGAGAADTGEGDEAPVKIDNQVDFWRVQIEAIYRRRNPIKLKEVSSLMEKHKGQEVILFKKVCKRYDLDPSKIYTREDAWEGEGKEFKDDPDDEGAASAAASAPIASASAPIASIFGDSTATSGGSIFGAATGGSSLFTSAGGTGSLFGASSGGSLFGSGTKDLFGGTSSSSSLGSSIFGTTSSSSAGKSLFGSASSSSFGDSGAFAPGKSLFDGSGNSASKIFEGGNLFAGGSSNLFGSGSGSSTGSLFGAPSASSSSGSSSGSIFGAPGAPPPSTGSIFCGSAERSASGSPFGGDAAALFGSSAGSGSDNIFAFGASGVPTAGSNKKKRRAE